MLKAKVCKFIGYFVVSIFLLLHMMIGLNAASLTIKSVNGVPKYPAAGSLVLDTTSIGRLAKAYRCAHTLADLSSSEWIAVPREKFNFSLLFPGFQYAVEHVVSCEIRYNLGPHLIVSAVEDMRQRTGESTLPKSFLHPSPGVLFHLAGQDTTGYGAWPLVHYNDQGLSIKNYGPGNNYFPLNVSKKYMWLSHYSWAVDKGEPLKNTVLVAHTSVRWLDSATKVIDLTLPKTEISIELKGAHLKLYSGNIHFAFLVVLPTGEHVRYHVLRKLKVGKNKWIKSGFEFSKINDNEWMCSFMSNNHDGCKNMPRQPDLRFVKSIEVVITESEHFPTGILKLRNLDIYQG